MIEPPIQAAPGMSESRMRRLRTALRRSLGINLPGRRRRRLRRLDPARVSRDDIIAHWEIVGGLLLSFGGVSAGNHVTLYTDGDEAFDALWREIENASQRIWFESYTIEPDRVGLKTLGLLADAALRGCEVKVICDAVGSSSLRVEHLRPLLDAGAEVDCFNPLFRWRRSVPLLRRDHRKIVVIDDHIGFCGGMNVSEMYAGKRHGNGDFLDCHARLAGPCVRDLAEVFLSTLRMIRRSHSLPPRTLPADGHTIVQVLGSRGVHGRRTIQRSLRLTVSLAARRCLITTPYFVPPRRLMRAMFRAARRGVDVRIMTAGKCDVPIVRRAARHIYGQFLQHDIRVFELFECMLHAKTLTIDGVYSTVGSFNLDHWSDQRNLEVNVGFIDTDVATQLENQFAENLKSAREVTRDNWQRRAWFTRLLDWACYHLLRL